MASSQRGSALARARAPRSVRPGGRALGPSDLGSSQRQSGRIEGRTGQTSRKDLTVFEIVFAETSALKDEKLCLATPSAHLFEGRFLEPSRACDLLLALSEVIGSRYYTPPAMVERLKAESDPVVTCSLNLSLIHI